MDNKIINLGKLNNKVLLFGGVYSNLQALEALIEVAKFNNISPGNCICTGDIVGYCAQPEESIQLFKNWGAISIAGNVELQLSEGKENCGCDFTVGSRCDDLSKIWYPYAKSKLSKSALDYLKELPQHVSFQFASQQITVVHGSYFNVSEFIYKSTPWIIKAPNFEATNSDMIIAGHCGLPFHHKNDTKLWLNPGVIGMPANNGKPSVWYAIIEETSAGCNFEHHELEYNHMMAHDLMIKENLPQAYAKTLLSGIWNNTDILPETEKRQQGCKIEL